MPIYALYALLASLATFALVPCPLSLFAGPCGPEAALLMIYADLAPRGAKSLPEQAHRARVTPKRAIWP